MEAFHFLFYFVLFICCGWLSYDITGLELVIYSTAAKLKVTIITILHILRRPPKRDQVPRQLPSISLYALVRISEMARLQGSEQSAAGTEEHIISTRFI